MQILYSSCSKLRWLLSGCILLRFAYPAIAQEPIDPATAAQVASNDHIFPGAAAAKPFIDFDRKGFLVNGRRTFLVSAGIEYARVPHELWEDRLLRLKRAGFNCIEIYTFWNFHEPRPGVFDFKGDHDLDAFLKLAKRMGLYAIVRVGPYYCAEWDNGGYPLWLRFQPGVRVREPNAVFEKYAGLFFDRLIPIVAANQVNRGGAVILVQLENEHPAGWGTIMPDQYFRFLRQRALSLGLEVPYFFSGLHHASDPAAESRHPAADPESLDDPSRPNPWLTTEFWSVWYNNYGSTEKEAKIYERRTWKIIAHGGNGYNYYMAHGGSNFGYTNNDEDAASYDYGAAVGQGGDLRPIYYAFKRAALFARSFQDILENSDDATESCRRVVTDTSVRVNARSSPAGTILFLDNASANTVTLPMTGDTLTLAPGEIRPIVEHYQLEPGITLARCASGILAFARQGHEGTLLVYGDSGSRARVFFGAKDKVKFLKGAACMAEAGGNLSLDAPIGGGGQAAEYSFSVHGWVLRVLVMNRELADRSWVLSDGGKRSIVCGPRYAGTLRVRSGRYYLNTEIESGRTGGFPVRIYTGSAVRTLKPLKESERMPAGNTGRRLSMSLSLGHWERKDGVSPAMPGFDDRRWTYNGIPLQMGADGDGTADAWYRTHVEIDTPGEYTLLVEGSDRAMAFSDGQRTVPFAIKNGEIPFVFTKGRHLLAVFTAHDGRDKLPAYTGPIDSADRKGLFGKALLVKGGPSIRSLDDWQVLKATAADDVKSGPPSPEVAGWQPYTIGQDAFAGKQGFGWFRMRLPDPPAGATQTVVHFASVDENATVFAGNRLLLRHAGWNAPFSVLIDRVDTFSRPIWLTVFVENYSNEGGIDKPVRAGALLAPVAVTGWRMRGGTGETTDSVRWSTVASKVGPEGPCWWRTTFLLPVLTQPGIVWRVITTGLGHGSIWINGHNLGRYPEKIPINGLYIPECWMKAGINSVQIYDEDGNNAQQVSIEAEPGASRWVTTLSAPL